VGRPRERDVGHRQAIVGVSPPATAPKPATVVLMVRRPKPGDPTLEDPKVDVLRGVNRTTGVLKGADPKIGRAPIAALGATTAVPMHALGQTIVDLRSAIRRAVRLTVADLAPFPAGLPKVLAAAKKAAIARKQARIPRPT
jgi:hypothetical protein